MALLAAREAAVVACVTVLVTATHQVVLDVCRAELPQPLPAFAAAARVGGIIVDICHFFNFAPHTNEVVFALHIRLHRHHVLLHEVVLGTFCLTLRTRVRGRIFEGIGFFAAQAANDHVEVAAFDPSLLHVGREFVHWFDGVAFATENAVVRSGLLLPRVCAFPTT